MGHFGIDNKQLFFALVEMKVIFVMKIKTGNINEYKFN